MKFRRLLFTLLLASGVILSSSAFARNYYGALAYNPRTGVTSYVVNAYSYHEAKRRARRICRRRHRGLGERRFYRRHACRAVVQFKNTCAAYATSGRYLYGWGYAPRGRWARRRAMRHCYQKGGRYCSVKVWACTSGRAYRRY